jgi:glyoxylase-like metal-dependent hydrolase (beta-lactamase superfamily II)
MTILKRHAFSRRDFCLCCLSASSLATTGGWLTPRQAYAEALGIVQSITSAAATTPIKVYRLRGNVAVLEGSGGNIAVLTGPDGKLLVDAGIAVSQPHLSRVLTTLDQEPITHLINTHWHFDHSNGNEWLCKLGPKILAHANTLKHLETIQRVSDWDYEFKPLSPDALPSETFLIDRSLVLNHTTVYLKYYGPAHTDSDAYVHLADIDILHTGDIFWNGIYPFIDYSTGGSIDGMIRAVEASLILSSNRTIIIPGHGAPVSNRAELLEFRGMLSTVRQRVATLKQQGRSFEDILKARPTAEYDQKWGQSVVGPSFFTRLVYEGV